jgi:hypothetical protein
MYNNNRIPRWREGAMLLKDFYKLTSIEKQQYVEEIKKIPVEELGDSDEYILHFFDKEKKKINNFLEL